MKTAYEYIEPTIWDANTPTHPQRHQSVEARLRISIDNLFWTHFGGRKGWKPQLFASSQQSLQSGLPFAGILIFYGHGQGFACTDKNGQFAGARQTGIYQVSEQHFEMLG